MTQGSHRAGADRDACRPAGAPSSASCRPTLWARTTGSSSILPGRSSTASRQAARGRYQPDAATGEANRLQRSTGRSSEIEKERVGAYGKLSIQVEEMAKHHLRLGAETQKLVNAMRNPGVRGRWGELQLRRVIELAGMQAHVDFAEQASFAAEDGRQRPDVIVKLPGGRTISDRFQGAVRSLFRSRARGRARMSPPMTRSRHEALLAPCQGGAQPYDRPGPQILLGAIPAQSGFRRHVPAGRRLFQRRAARRSRPLSRRASRTMSYRRLRRP